MIEFSWLFINIFADNSYLCAGEKGGGIIDAFSRQYASKRWTLSTNYTLLCLLRAKFYTGNMFDNQFTELIYIQLQQFNVTLADYNG
jgi:hypothetical protein